MGIEVTKKFTCDDCGEIVVFKPGYEGDEIPDKWRVATLIMQYFDAPYPRGEIFTNDTTKYYCGKCGPKIEDKPGS